VGNGGRWGGEVCVVPTGSQGIPRTGRLIGITPNENVHTEFLNYYLITQQPEMVRLAPKGRQKNINIQFLKPWPFPLPSFEEQREIA